MIAKTKKKKPGVHIAPVYQFEWSGDLKEKFLEFPNFPTKALKIDDWYSPSIGELCWFDGKIDVVKDITWRNGDHLFKPGRMYEFESSDSKFGGSVIRIEVKRNKTFILNGRIFVHQQPLCGSYIDKIAKREKIEEYEYEQYK